MKNIIVALILLSASNLVFAQANLVKPANHLFNNSLFYSKLKSHSGTAKINYFLLLDNNRPYNYKHFLELYSRHQATVQITPRHISFMNGTVMFPSLPPDISQGSSPSYQKYSPTNPSAALTILGLVGGMVAGAVYPSYIGNTYHNNGAAVEAYLQSTYYQHNK